PFNLDQEVRDFIREATKDGQRYSESEVRPLMQTAIASHKSKATDNPTEEDQEIIERAIAFMEKAAQAANAMLSAGLAGQAKGLRKAVDKGKFNVGDKVRNNTSNPMFRRSHPTGEVTGIINGAMAPYTVRWDPAPGMDDLKPTTGQY